VLLGVEVVAREGERGVGAAAMNDRYTMRSIPAATAASTAVV